ncbi:MAG TPA: 2-phosphosulfolactate phosphatase [Longimicrobium sp.]|nr:2-phosphosulfolactate phosphatase [Longimicrobium sp.]
MNRTVAIDSLPEAALRYGRGWAVVCVDVIRATTTAVTAAARGIRCFPVPTLDAAAAVASVLDRPLLCGELGGNMPFGFDLTNSPARVDALGDEGRPLVLLSSSGTQLVHNAARSGADAVYVACLRNWGAMASHLFALHPRVAVIGAGTRGEFREEDQRCCALVGAALAAAGHQPASELTRDTLARWHRAPVTGWLQSRSVDYLRRSGQLADLDFILAHLNDLTMVFAVEDGEVVARHPVSGRPAHAHQAAGARA